MLQDILPLLWDGGLNLTENTFFLSRVCPWTNTAETLTPAGLSDMPLKRVNLLINTNYNFSTGNSASQAQPLLLYYSQPGLSPLKQRNHREGLYANMSNKGRDCFRGAQHGSNYMTRHKMYILKSYISLNCFREGYQTLC